MNPKVIVSIFFSILIGFLFGQVIFKEYDSNTITVFEEGEKVYFILVNSFSSKSSITEEYDKESYLILNENDSYNIYAGITKNKKLAEQIKDYYIKSSNNIDVKEKMVSNKTFLNLVTEYDKVSLLANKVEDVLNLEKIIISNYKELVLEI